MTSRWKEALEEEMEELVDSGDYGTYEQIRYQFKDPFFDEELEGVVLDLNDAGYLTRTSCAGHRPGEHGWIIFDTFGERLNARERKEILDLARKHGLQFPHITIQGHNVQRLVFDRLGRTKD